MKILKRNNLELLQFPRMSEDCNIFHFCTTRKGGVSQGKFASMNPARFSADLPDCVQKNIRLLSEAIDIPTDQIITAHQIHGDHILTIQEQFFQKEKAEQEFLLEGVDALVTAQPGVCVTVVTADCVPILLYAPDKKVVAAIHAGWRGILQRIAEKTARLLVDRYGCDPQLMLAGIGPAISLPRYEVGDDLVEAFIQEKFPITQFVSRNPQTGHPHFDLKEANRWQLRQAGLTDRHIEISGLCTYSNSELFFSARRMGNQCGRILSGIYMR